MLGALIALLCVNGVGEQMFNAASHLHDAERLIERAELTIARSMLLDMQFLDDKTLRMRALDLQALVKMRAPKKHENRAWVVTHMRDRAKANPKDVRYRAWLAEALLAEGRLTEALAQIKPLQDQDLMPDAFAYLVLAKLSIDKPREAALAACRTRAKVKTICSLD
jgi:hypothetical protein